MNTDRNVTFGSAVKLQLVSSVSHILDSYSVFFEIKTLDRKASNSLYNSITLLLISKTCIHRVHIYFKKYSI
jgi:hypothetical protein